jgi:adenylate cyclase
VQEHHVTRKLSAILAADVVGYSRLMGVDEEGTLERFKAHRTELIDRKIAEHQGRIVKTTGDGLLVEFSSVVDAVRCAVEIQRDMAERNADLPQDRRIDFRIGINLGDIIVDGDDIYGDGVNVAARLEALAAPGGICVSRTVCDHVQDKLSFAFEDMGDQRVKNIARPVHVMRVVLDATMPAVPMVKAAGAVPPGVSRRRLWLGALAVLLVLAIGAAASWRLGYWRGAAPAASDDLAAGGDRPSIAVLPFANLGDMPRDVLADGLTEDVVSELAMVSGLFVASRSTAAQYTGEATDIAKAGRGMGVRYVLEGSVRKVGDELRVIAQLVEVATGEHIWAGRYDQPFGEALKAQDEITEAITTQLVVEMRHNDLLRARRKPPQALRPYDYYLLGREAAMRDDFQGLAEAGAMFGKALAADAGYAPALGGLALVYFKEFYLHRGTLRGDAALARVFDTGQRSLAIDPTSAGAYYAIATTYLFRRQFSEAIEMLRKIIARTADDADLQARLGEVYAFAGDPAKAVETLQRIMRLNPYYPPSVLAYLGRAQLMLGRFDDAAFAAETCASRAPEYRPCFEIEAVAYAEKGMADEASSAIAQLRRADPEFTLATAPAVMPFQRSGDLARFLDGLRKAGLD